MKKTLLIALLASICVTAHAQSDFDKVLLEASAGVYQAQRNLAYGYVEFPYKGQNLDPAKGCGWYLIVLKSAHPQVHDGDVDNATVYCNKINDEQKQMAVQLAQEHFDFWERHNYKGYLRPRP